MRRIKINYGIDTPIYVTITTKELRKAFSSVDNFDKFIRKLKNEIFIERK